MNKYCYKCKQDKDLTLFSRNRSKASTYQDECKACRLLDIKKYHRNANQRLKSSVIAHYSNSTNKCACCGINELVFLCIDHINNDGASHRRSIKKSSGTGTYKWLVHNKFPPGFQVLCFNCNLAKHIVGICPHNTQALRLVG